jgi:O-antigen/teichoic acid export membrane protein
MIRRLSSSPAALNAGASYFGFVSTSLYGLLSIPVAVHYLEKSEIGLWAVVNTMLSYLVWMDLGIGSGMGRLMGEAVANDDRDEIDRWWTATRVTLWVQGAIVIILGVLLVPVLIQWMDIDSQLRDDTWHLLLGGVLITGLSFPVRGTIGLLTAQNRFHWVLLMQAIAPWCGFIVFYLCLRAGWGLKSYLASLVVSQIVIWVCCRSSIVFGPYTPKWNGSGVKKARFLTLFSLSGNMAIVGLVGAVLKGLPTLMLARLGGLTMVPVYNFTSRAPFLGGSLIGRTYQSFYPSLQRLHVLGKREAFLKKHLAVGRVSLSGALCGAAIVLAVNPMIVQLIAADHYFAGLMANMWFAVALVTTPFAGLFQILLPISGSMGKAATVSIVKLFVSMFFAILGWKWFGLAGVAAVFALQPLVDLGYAWLRGVKGCGYTYREISPQLLALGFLTILLTFLTGSFVAASDQSPTVLRLFSQQFEFPGQSALWATAGLFLIGLIFLGCSLWQLIKER